MNIPKNAGLSRLAEAASPITHYPVKRKGERRRLLPNWQGIEWLERESADDCEIYYEDEDCENGLVYTRAYGKMERDYSRPMFQVIEMHATIYFRGRKVTPCQCDRFEVSWNCPDHPEIDWNAERRCWVRPGTSIWYELHPEDRPEGWGAQTSQPTAYYTEDDPVGRSVAEQLVRSFQRILDGSYSGQADLYINTLRGTWCTCSMCQPRDARDSLRYAGFDQGVIRRRGEMLVHRDNVISMEVNGETVQGVDSFTIETLGDVPDGS